MNAEERLRDAYAVVAEAQRMAFEALEASGAALVEPGQRTPEQARLVAMYSLIHDGVKRLAGRGDVELSGLDEARVLVIEYRQELAEMRAKIADYEALHAEVERLREVERDAQDLRAEIVPGVTALNQMIMRLVGERDEARAQLAEAHEALDQSAEVMSSLGRALTYAEARLESVRAEAVRVSGVVRRYHSGPNGLPIDGKVTAREVYRIAVLAGAPEPERVTAVIVRNDTPPEEETK